MNPTELSASIVSNLGWHLPAQSPSRLPCQKWTPKKVRITFYTPVHAARRRIGPLSANHGPFTPKTSSCHVHSTLLQLYNATKSGFKGIYLIRWRRQCFPAALTMVMWLGSALAFSSSSTLLRASFLQANVRAVCPYCCWQRHHKYFW